ncbi:MAG: hypothetical protein EXR66_03590 [Dehalococcoidia bacterium]|nr:hypothetical protein [Dehalococcoidia bacterium]
MSRIDFVTGNALIYLPDVELLATVPDRAEALARHASGGSGGRGFARVLGDMVAYAEHDQVALHRMAWMADPVIKPLDLEVVAETEQWTGHRPAGLIDRLTKAIAETVDLLKDQPDAAWGRAGLFPERRSLRQQVRRSAAHYEAELAALK